MALQFTSQDGPRPTHPHGPGGHDSDAIVIVGAGFAGIGMAIRLKQAGIEDFVILERADRLGGTWRDNTYPGIACDVPSYLYSFSFEPNPDWTRFFAPQREILAYLERCADKYDVRKHIRFSTEVVGATFDERTGLWSLRVAPRGEGGRQNQQNQQNQEDAMTARVVISGSGHSLSKPVFPDIPGRASFRGKTMHSARWDHDYPLQGKRVAVIGTGASAVQIVPAIAGDVGSMQVYQRTAAWVQPRPDREISPRQQRVLRDRPFVQQIARRAIYWVLETMAVGYVVDPRINRIRELRSTAFLRQSVRDPALRAKLTPRFRLGSSASCSRTTTTACSSKRTWSS